MKIKYDERAKNVIANPSLVIASETKQSLFTLRTGSVKQSRFCRLIKTKDCFVTPFLAMTTFSTAYRIVKISLFAVLFSLSMIIFPGCTGNAKEPSVAGSFYPADGNELKVMVNMFLARAENKPVEGRLIALVSPHAGYQYSGQVAAFTYNHLNEREIDTVILIGPSHHASFKGASVYTAGSLKTPLGNIKIDESIAKSLLNEKADVRFYPEAFEKEHSLEVQLPFLQQTLKNFRIVPIIMGSPTRESLDHLTEKLMQTLSKNEKTIIIASTDLSHYHDYNTAVTMDNKITDAVQRMSLEDVEMFLSRGEGEMCGAYPVILTMAVARGLGATNGVLYKYANSGDVTGDKSSVVGYGAIGLYKSGLSKEEKEELLLLAKKTIFYYVMHKKVLEADPKDIRLKANGATFVTITRNGDLRGCVGNIQPVMPLYKSVITNAVSAATRDPRFPPMIRQELGDMSIEISVLSPMELLSDTNKIIIGRHGLFILNGENSGLLLPKVASDFKWDVNTFLEQVSVKAGLPKDAWKDKNTRLYTFIAEVF
jgi:MEMO1 family protein